MPDERQFTVTLDRRQRYEFETRFDWAGVPPLLLDEPEPLGEQKGPNAARLIGAAVGNCLTASLVFCVEKGKLAVRSTRTDVTGTIARNGRGRMRLARLDVRITLDVGAEQRERVARCLELFEDYCVVTAGVRQGIPVSVVVLDPEGRELYRQEDAPREPA